MGLDKVKEFDPAAELKSPVNAGSLAGAIVPVTLGELKSTESKRAKALTPETWVLSIGIVKESGVMVA